MASPSGCAATTAPARPSPPATYADPLPYRFANGRSETPGEYGEVGRLQRGFAANGFRLRWLLGEIATSAAFRTATAPEVTR
jgi:hypothetical protein